MKTPLLALCFLGLVRMAPAASTPTVTYLLDSSWSTGLQAEITIANPSTAALNNWSLSFTYPYSMTSIWNAAIVSHVGNVYTIAGASWDPGIAAGGSVNFGWIASTNGTAGGPTGCMLNQKAIFSASCPSSGGPVDTTPPTVPANLKSTAQTTSSISLSWSASSDSGSGVAGYYVWEGAVMLASVTSTSYTASGLAQNASYSFTVQAFDNAGNISAHSSTLTVSTKAVVPCTALPAAPGVPTALTVTSSSATVSWAASAPQANCTLSYTVYENTAVVASGLTVLDYQFSGLSPSTTYTLGVAATNQAGNSAQVTVKVTTSPYVPPPPSGWPTHVFAPYIDMTAWPTPSVSSIAAATGQNYYTLAFVVTQGTCAASWGGVEPVSTEPTLFAADIAALRQASGNVIVSFGGENGQALAQSCTSVAGLEAQYQAVIDTYGLTRIDFDIEGGAVADHNSIDLRNRALAGLQAVALAANKPLIVDYTLPVLPTGLTQDGVNLLTDAVQNGVNIGVVNLMAMDYGGYFNPSAMGANAVSAVEATYTQLQGIYGGSKTPAQLYAMLGATPMIGMNDVPPEVFTLADAATVLNFAETNQMGLIAMWSVGRDGECPNGGAYVASNCSGVAQTPYAYMAVFRPFSH